VTRARSKLPKFKGVLSKIAFWAKHDKTILLRDVEACDTLLRCTILVKSNLPNKSANLRILLKIAEKTPYLPKNPWERETISGTMAAQLPYPCFIRPTHWLAW
jgi:hypothetical protein